jgi:hypothetical protein
VLSSVLFLSHDVLGNVVLKESSTQGNGVRNTLVLMKRGGTQYGIGLSGRRGQNGKRTEK